MLLMRGPVGWKSRDEKSSRVAPDINLEPQKNYSRREYDNQGGISGRIGFLAGVGGNQGRLELGDCIDRSDEQVGENCGMAMGEI